MSHKFKNPERRPGNRGLGKVLNMNKEKGDDKKMKFKHIPDRKHLKKVMNKVV
jgi:hypothetical protein